MSRKNSLDVRSSVSGFFFSLLLVFSPMSSPFFVFVFFLRDKAQVVTGHTPTRTLCCFFLFLFCPATLVCSPFLAVRPVSWRFFGGGGGVLRLFSHQLEGADPSSYVAYPRVVVPAPRPSEGPGAPSRAPVWTRAKVSGYFFASLCLAEGHRDPRDHFGRGGAFCPIRHPFCTRTSLLPPQVFFCFFLGPWGLASELECPTRLE